MEKFLSSWSQNVESLPESYIFPPESRPGSQSVPLCSTIPVVDLSKSQDQDRTILVHQILRACQEYGFFQVIGHGVSKELMDSTMSMFKELFAMPEEDKASLCIDEIENNKSSKIYTSSMNYANEQLHFWRENLRHPCHPLEECKQHWPQKPTSYREVVGTYSIETRKLSKRILELICEGLGLESGYFESDDQLSNSVILSVNYYPPCPEPSLALGLPKHSDPNLITILLQDDVYGLQVFKNGAWIGVEPLPNAFVVNIGYQLQIISNGNLKSAHHRVVTNSSTPRTSCALFIYPSTESNIGPAQALVTAQNPQLYRAFQYKEFLMNYATNSANEELALAPFKFQASD